MQDTIILWSRMSVYNTLVPGMDQEGIATQVGSTSKWYIVGANNIVRKRKGGACCVMSQNG